MVQVQEGQILFSRYQVVKLIGEGSTGRVFLVQDTNDNSQKAIKVIDVEKHKYPLESVLRFRTESDTLKNIHHKNIIKYYDFCQEENLYGLVTEYNPGITLQDFVLKNKEIKAGIILEILLQISNALHAIHIEGLVHHDLKSANILIGKKSKSIDLRILDFGLSHLIEHQQNKVTGTLAYMAPEMTGILKKMIDHRADLYSLGIIAYELATATLPFRDPDPAILMHQHLANTPKAPIEINPKLPLVLNNMILKLLKKDPMDRYKSVQGFLRDLNKLIRFYEKNGHYDTDYSIALEDQWGSFPAENPFVGRHVVLESILNFLGTEDGIYIIEGARGIGKSSLIKEIYNETKKNSQNKVYYYRPHSEEKPVRLSGLRGLLQTLLDFVIQESIEDQSKKIKKIKSVMGVHFDTLLELLPEFNNVCLKYNISITETKLDDYLTVCKRLINYGIQKNQDVIIIVDDAQYMDSASLDILVAVMSLLNTKKTSLIITYNRELVGSQNKALFRDLENKQSVRQFCLEPFAESQTAELLQELFSKSLIELPQLLEPLQDVCGGNPRRLRNVLQDLIDHELLFLEGKSWKTKIKEAIVFIRSNQNITSSDILKSFSHEEMKVLQRGAIFHRAFSISAALALEKKQTSKTIDKLKLETSSNKRILKVLDKAQALGILTSDSQNLYAFRDHSLRSLIRDQIDPSLRKIYHNGVALFLHKNILHQSNAAVYDIAHHYDRAGKDYQAMRHFVLAARLTENHCYNNKQSQIYYNLAANKIRNGKVVKISNLKKFDILFSSAFHNYNINSSGYDIQSDLNALEDLIEGNDSRKLKWLTLQANYSFITGQRKEMLKAAEQAISLPGIKKENFFILICLTLLGIVPTGKSYSKRAKLLAQVVEVSIQLNQYEDIGRPLTILINMLTYIGKFHEAQKWIQKVEENISKANPSNSLNVFFAKGMLAIESGDFLKFKKEEKQINKLLESIETSSRYFLEAHAGRVYAMLGEYKRSLLIYERLLDNDEKSVRRGIEAISLYGRTILANQMEDYEVALDYYDRSIEYLKDFPDPYKHAEFDIEASRAFVFLGEYKKAHEVLNLAKKYAKKLKSEPLDTHIEFAQARLGWFQNKDKDSIEEARNVAEDFKKMGADGYCALYLEEVLQWVKNTKTHSGSSLQGSSQESRELYQLLEINHKISSMLDSKSLLKEVLSGAMRITGAQHGYLFLIETIKKPALSLDSRGKNITIKKHSYSKSVVLECKENALSILTRDAVKEKKWSIIESISQKEMRSILSVPIVHQGEMLGILYLDNHAARSVFSMRDKQIVENFAIQAAIAMYNARLYERERIARQKMEATLATFERFIPKNFTDRFAQGNVELLEAGLSKEENLTILFSDIREFTSISESLSASNLFVLLNDYLKFMELPIRNANGFVDKYIGDAIMAIFDRAPIDAIEAAIGMQRALRKLNYLKKKKKGILLVTGIGINTGNSMIGVIGSKGRIDTTVMGDAVNTASRMESLTKTYNTSILISESTYNSVRHRENLHIRFVDRVRILGKKENTSIYEVFNHEDKKLIDKKLKYMNLFESAWQSYCNGQWSDATKEFQEYQRKVKGDQLPNIFLQRLVGLEKNNPVGWNGTFLQDSK